jgi:Zinc finger, C2H2 type
MIVVRTDSSLISGQMYRVLRKTAIPSRCLPGQSDMSRPNQRNGSEYVTSKYMKIDEVKSFCRCCLKIDSDSRNMKETRMILDGSTINLFDAFFDCTSFKILKIDEHAQICDLCVDDLKRTIVFLSQCQASDALINNLFGNSSTADDTTDTENDEGGDLLVPMRSGAPVVLTKQEPQSSPPKPVIKTEKVDIDYEDMISTAQIRPTKRGYAIKRTASSAQLQNKRKSTQTPYSDEVIGESVDQEDSEWTVKSMKNVNSSLKKRGRPKKCPKLEQFPTSEVATSPDNKEKPTNTDSPEKRADSETDTADSGAGGNAKPLKRQRGRPKGVTAKRKYNKWVYLSPTAPLDISEMMPLTNAKPTVSTSPGTTASTARPGTTGKKRWPYVCNECNETFKLQVYLRYHQKSMHSMTPASGKLKKNTTESNYNRKLKYCCKRCSKVFDSLAEYQLHLGEHSAKPKSPRFECSMCNTGFFRLERFEAHIVKEHKITMKKYTPKYHCNRCRMNFHVADDFYNHPKFCKSLKNNTPTTSIKPTTNGTEKIATRSPKSESKDVNKSSKGKK